MYLEDEIDKLFEIYRKFLLVRVRLCEENLQKVNTKSITKICLTKFY